MRQWFRRSLKAPKEKHLAYSRRVLELSYLHSEFGEHRDDAESSIERRQKNSEYLIRMASGNWKKQRIVHHCKPGCCKSLEARFRTTLVCVCLRLLLVFYIKH